MSYIYIYSSYVKETIYLRNIKYNIKYKAKHGVAPSFHTKQLSRFTANFNTDSLKISVCACCLVLCDGATVASCNWHCTLSSYVSMLAMLCIKNTSNPSRCLYTCQHAFHSVFLQLKLPGCKYFEIFSFSMLPAKGINSQDAIFSATSLYKQHLSRVDKR